MKQALCTGDPRVTTIRTWNHLSIDYVAQIGADCNSSGTVTLAGSAINVNRSCRFSSAWCSTSTGINYFPMTDEEYGSGLALRKKY